MVIAIFTAVQALGTLVQALSNSVLHVIII